MSRVTTNDNDFFKPHLGSKPTNHTGIQNNSKHYKLLYVILQQHYHSFTSITKEVTQ
ncbi:hypothetical protein Hanom_Chr08g00731901 [Helianthus anomalus]